MKNLLRFFVIFIDFLIFLVAISWCGQFQPLNLFCPIVHHFHIPNTAEVGVLIMLCWYASFFYPKIIFWKYNFYDLPTHNIILDITYDRTILIQELTHASKLARTKHARCMDARCPRRWLTPFLNIAHASCVGTALIPFVSAVIVFKTCATTAV